MENVKKKIRQDMRASLGGSGDIEKSDAIDVHAYSQRKYPDPTNVAGRLEALKEQVEALDSTWAPPIATVTRPAKNINAIYESWIDTVSV